MKKFLVMFFVATLCFGLAGTASAGPIVVGDVFTFDYSTPGASATPDLSLNDLYVPSFPNYVYVGNDRGLAGDITSINTIPVVFLAKVLIDDGGKSGSYNVASDVKFYSLKAGDYTIFYAATATPIEWNTSNFPANPAC
jgi:hypothetical protein